MEHGTRPCDDRAADDGATTDRAADDRATTDRAADDRAVHDRAVHDRAVVRGYFCFPGESSSGVLYHNSRGIGNWGNCCFRWMWMVAQAMARRVSLSWVEALMMGGAGARRVEFDANKNFSCFVAFLKKNFQRSGRNISQEKTRTCLLSLSCHCSSSHHCTPLKFSKCQYTTQRSFDQNTPWGRSYVLIIIKTTAYKEHEQFLDHSSSK